MRLFICVTLAATVSALPAAQGGKPVKGPETFSANAHVQGKGGALAGTIKIQIDRYVAESDRQAIAGALKTGGHPAFLAALRKAPALGQVTASDRTVTVRWATQSPIKNGRTIVAVTDGPIFFVGSGKVDAKPREGYDVAVIRFDIDDAGLGQGTMAAAARVKPGGTTGVEIDDYAEAPIKLVTVTKAIQ